MLASSENPTIWTDDTSIDKLIEIEVPTYHEVDKCEQSILPMDRATFLNWYRGFTWFLILVSFFYNSWSFFIVIMVMIFARNTIANRLYGPPVTPYGQQPGTPVINRLPKPVCHECGGNNPRDAVYCQDCGTPLDREPQISYDEFK